MHADHICSLPILALTLPLSPLVIVLLLLSCFENILETPGSTKFAGKKYSAKLRSLCEVSDTLVYSKSSGREEALTDSLIQFIGRQTLSLWDNW